MLPHQFHNKRRKGDMSKDYMRDQSLCFHVSLATKFSTTVGWRKCVLHHTSHHSSPERGKTRTLQKRDTYLSAGSSISEELRLLELVEPHCFQRNSHPVVLSSALNCRCFELETVVGCQSCLVQLRSWYMLPCLGGPKKSANLHFEHRSRGHTE